MVQCLNPGRERQKICILQNVQICLAPNHPPMQFFPTHLYLAPVLRVSGAMPLLPLCPFIAHAGTVLPLVLPK